MGLLCIALLVLPSAAEPEGTSPANRTGPKRVLYINSYHSGFIWSDGIEQGFRNRLSASDFTIQLYSEYLDARRFPSLDYIDSLADAFAKKYKNISCDLVAVSDNAAFEFAIKYREKLFPGVPIVFCGFNNFTPEVIQGISNITGVSETVDYRGTINMALGIQPGTKELVFISSTFSVSSKQILHAAEEVIADFQDRYKIVMLKDLPVAVLEKRLRELPMESVVFIMGEATDIKEGKFYPVEQYSRELADASPVPIYTMWDFYLNAGVLGGSVVIGRDQGKAMGDLALQILNGIPADKIPVVGGTLARKLADHNVLHRFGISENALPPGTTVFNKPETFYERNRTSIWIGAAIFTFMGGIVAGLSLLLRRSIAFQRDLRRSEEELRQEQEKLSLAISAGDLGAWAYNPKTDEMEISDRGKAMLGLQPEAKVTQASFLNFVHPEDRPNIQKAINDSLEGKDYNVEHRIIKPDGEVRWIALKGKCVRDAEGRPARFLGTTQDVTNEKLTKDRLVRVTQLYAALSQCNQAIVHAKSMDELFPQICRDIVTFGGIKLAWIGLVDEATGDVRPVASYGSGTEYLEGIEVSIHGDKPSGRGPAGASIRNNAPYWCDDFQNDPNTGLWHERSAKYGWMASAGLPLRMRGKPIGSLTLYTGKEMSIDEDERGLLVEMAHEISFALDNFSREAERKKAEESLAASESRFKSVFNEAPLGIAVVDSLTGHFYSVNPMFAKITGRTMAELLQINWISITHPDDVQPDLDQMAQMNEGKISGFHMEKRYLLPDGSYVWINITVAPLFVENKAAPRHLLMIDEITERKRMEDALKTAKDEAEAANSAKDQFIAVLSHELRTPLTPVLATLSAIEIQNQLSEELRADLEVVRRNVKLEAELVGDLLDITAIARKKVELRMESVDIHDSLESAIEITKADMEAKHLRLEREFQAHKQYVWADPVRLRQVFWNLLTNAVKFTPENGRITIRTRNARDRIIIEVADTGIGIETQVMPRIFNLFEQGEQTRARRFGGLGLGLHIAKTVVELHGGTLTARSDGRNKGSVFTVDLATTAVPQPRMAPPAIEKPPVTGESIKILLVDDHPDTLRIIARLLEKWGYTVKTADSVASAMVLVTSEQFDILVSDIGLPDGSGLDIMRHAKERYGMRGVAFSGFGTEEDIQQSRAAGFDEHLTKPIATESLRAAIGRIAIANSSQ